MYTDAEIDSIVERYEAAQLWAVTDGRLGFFDPTCRDLEPDSLAGNT